MEIDGTEYSPVYEPPPSEPDPSPEAPPSDPPPSVYGAPQDGVDWSSSGSSSTVDSSAAAWAEGTIAAAEAYSAMAPRENEFTDKTAEQRAQDAFWENDPNRPPPAAPSPPPAAPPPPEDDTNYKHPGLKPEGPPPETGPVQPLPGGSGTTPPGLVPPAPAPTPPWLGPNPPPPPPPTPSPITTVTDMVKNTPVRPTHTSTPEGGHVIGISTNPPPTPPKPVDPTAPKPPNTYP
jgi:hypothetical protein